MQSVRLHGSKGDNDATAPAVTVDADGHLQVDVLTDASGAVMDDWDESDRCKVNPIVGQAGVAAGSGVKGTTTQRVTLATDDNAVTALEKIDDWDESDRAKVNPIVGQAGIAAGTGTRGATTPRVTIATDDEAVASLGLLDDIVGTIDGAFSGKVTVIGGKAESTIPTEVSDGDAVAAWIDTFGRFVIAGYNLASGKMDVTASNYPMTPISNAWTALTAAGSTSVIDVSYYTDITIKTVVAAINTSVDWKLEGSMDGTNFFDMKDQDGTAQIQKLANGTYHRFYSLRNDHANGKYANFVRFTFAAEAGGTDVTLTPTIYARR